MSSYSREPFDWLIAKIQRQYRQPRISSYELAFMAITSFIIVFGCAGLYEALFG